MTKAKQIGPNVDLVGMEEVSAIAHKMATEEANDPQRLAYIAAMESPEEVEARAWEKEHNCEPQNSFPDEQDRTLELRYMPIVGRGPFQDWK